MVIVEDESVKRKTLILIENRISYTMAARRTMSAV